MNTVASKTLKPVVEVTVSFAMSEKQVAYGIRPAQGERSKVITGVADTRPMTAALKAIKGALKSENLHLNIRHNSPKFHQWLYHTPNAFQTIKAMLGVTAFANLGETDGELVKAALQAIKPARKRACDQIRDA
jgi:hypothetical protein